MLLSTSMTISSTIDHRGRRTRRPGGGGAAAAGRGSEGGEGRNGSVLLSLPALALFGGSLPFFYLFRAPFSAAPPLLGLF